MAKPNPDTIRMLSVLLSMLTSVSVTLHVLFIHQKFVEKEDERGNAYIELQDTESFERGFLIFAVLLYIVAFAMLIWSDRQQRKNSEGRMVMLEKVMGSGGNYKMY